jgi:carboxyl-terminal processing protease
MSNLLRSVIAGLVILLLLLIAFAAGVAFNEYGGVEAAGNNSLSGADDGFALLDEAWALVEGNYLGELPSLTQVTYGAVRGALAVVNDPYTVFIEPPARNEERERLSGNFGGIGAYLSRNEDNELLLEPIPDNPAERAGILLGDVLLAVDGVPITSEMAVSDVAELIKGEKGTIVTLTISREGEIEPFDVAVERDEILLPSVSFKILEADPAIGLIQLTRFSGESGQEIERAITELQGQGAEMLILDLRNNPGGLLTAAVDVADHFLGDVPVLYQQSQGQAEEEYRAAPGAVAGDMPLVVLVNGGTASSAEILAGALQDHERAYLIGAPTFGKGSVQLVFDLSDGSSVHVTASRWFTPDRHQIDQQGLQPDLVVEDSQEAIDAGQDEPLLRAIEYLQREN